MTERKKIPIGIEDFREMIDKNCYFVDKTLMIKDILDSGAKVTLFTRPRRFGKTLNMSMLRYFFEKSEQDNSYLFDDFAISGTGEKYLSHMGQYPVISISLKSMKQATYEAAFEEFIKIVSDEFRRHQELLRSEKMFDSDKALFMDICNRKGNFSTYNAALKFLSNRLYDEYGKNIIVLIDEYDVPLEAAYFNGFYEPMVNLIRSVFEIVLKTNSSLGFAVLTGCLRISKESIFTGLNNLKVNSIRAGEMSEYFGFTENEVKGIAEYYGIFQKFEEIKKWYDGYRFGLTEIYNLWSVLNYAQSLLSIPDAPPEPYWSNTSSNSIIRKLITESDTETRDMIEILMNGESITAPIFEDTIYADIDVNSDRIWSFLLFTGYLKQIKTELSADDILVSTLVIPNLEVRSIYRHTIRQWLKEQISSSPRQELFEALLNKDTAKVEEILCDWLDETISYYDEKEQYYHGFLAGLLSGFKGYTLKSNRESGDGSPDLILVERRKRAKAIIIEVKDTRVFTQLEKLCDDALAQIEQNRYETELKHEGYQEIIKYGIAFCEKSCVVKVK